MISWQNHFLKVFISHAGHDNHVVYKLLKILDDNQIEKWVDLEQLDDPDSDINENINESLSSSDYFSLIWSENAAKSEFVKRKYNAAISHDYDKRLHKIILRLDDCILPPLLASKKYHKIREKEFDSVLDRIITSIKKGADEQQKIASILSNVDFLIQQTQKIIGQTQRLRKGLMQRLLTKGIGHTKFKKVKWYYGKEIEIPEGWQIRRLNQMSTDFISGGTPSTLNPDYWNGKIPWMRSAWIKGRYVNSGEKYITEDGMNDTAANLVPKGSLLVATRVSLGNITINNIDMAISQDLTGVVIDKSTADKEFLYWALLQFSNITKGFGQGTAILGILREDLEHLKVALPPLSEQQKIASILSNVDSLIQVQQKHKSKLENHKKGLMQILLTGRIRVKA